ncbi:MAG: NAD(P)H-dependent oxidoreductase subunit E [Burkholderiales bacterium]|nr:NAD(P)H-dependent oxidoreductase subunit E [Phycisphaerae bacterium]
MPWISEDRRHTRVAEGQPLLTESLKAVLRDKYFPRYPSKRAVLLPALHLLQHEYNWLPTQAVQEIAEFLEIAPAEALDTASFYEEYWLKPKGKYLLQVCRSLTCELCQSEQLRDHLSQKLNVDPGETTADKRFTLVELECLGACGTAPVVMVNEVLHENVTTDRLDQIIAALPEDPHDMKDPGMTWDNDGH